MYKIIDSKGNIVDIYRYCVSAMKFYAEIKKHNKEEEYKLVKY